MVSGKFERLRHIHFTSAMISEMEVMRYIRELNLGKAAGADGLTTEHYVSAIGSSVPLHISFMLTLCLQHGLVPETFLHGVLIPIYKTGKDSSKTNSYRPVTLSVTLTKILEMYILETCSVHHQPHPAIHHRSNFLHIGCEIAECKDLQIPGGGARESIALRACETANPSNKRCLS